MLQHFYKGVLQLCPKRQNCVRLCRVLLFITGFIPYDGGWQFWSAYVQYLRFDMQIWSVDDHLIDDYNYDYWSDNYVFTTGYQ